MVGFVSKSQLTGGGIYVPSPTIKNFLKFVSCKPSSKKHDNTRKCFSNQIKEGNLKNYLNVLFQNQLMIKVKLATIAEK
jgi:hypothetical protein